MSRYIVSWAQFLQMLLAHLYITLLSEEDRIVHEQ